MNVEIELEFMVAVQEAVNFWTGIAKRKALFQKGKYKAASSSNELPLEQYIAILEIEKVGERYVVVKTLYAEDTLISKTSWDAMFCTSFGGALYDLRGDYYCYLDLENALLYLSVLDDVDGWMPLQEFVRTENES